MAGTFGIGVRELVDEHQRRPALEDAVEVHFLEHTAAVGQRAPRQDLESLGQCRRFLAAMRLDDADDDIDPVRLTPPSREQHLVGLADTGRGAKEDLELAALLRLKLFEQRVR